MKPGCYQFAIRLVATHGRVFAQRYFVENWALSESDSSELVDWAMNQELAFSVIRGLSE